MTPAMRRFARYAWGVLVLNLFVILWGAVVRATGSGAGCGSHWPLCDGAVVPPSPRFETIVEFTHRLTSGLALLAVVALVVWAWRLFPKRSDVRRAAVASLVLILIEAAIGAGLVLFELVGANASWTRAAYLAVHLCNTLFLLAALALTAFLAGRRRTAAPPDRATTRLGGAVLVLLLITGATGAIAALGDTLAPNLSLGEGLRQDLSPVTALLLRVRVFHPLLAIVAAAAAFRLARALPRRHPGPDVLLTADALAFLVILQIGVGLLNLVLLAPLVMQLIHLLVADVVWIAAVLALAVPRWGRA